MGTGATIVDQSGVYWDHSRMENGIDYQVPSLEDDHLRGFKLRKHNGYTLLLNLEILRRRGEWGV